MIARAGEGTRTLDIQLGKLALCQLSYARIVFSRLSISPLDGCSQAKRVLQNRRMFASVDLTCDSK